MASWIDDLNGVVGALGSVANTVVDTKNNWSGSNNAPQTNTSLDNLASSIAASASNNKKTILLIGGGALVLIALILFIRK